MSQTLSGPQFPPLANKSTLLGDSMRLSTNEVSSALLGPGVVWGSRVGLDREGAIYSWEIWNYMHNLPADPWKPIILAVPTLPVPGL